MEELFDIETIKVNAMILHVESTLNHWATLKNKHTVTHRDKLISELKTIAELSVEEVMSTQGVV